MTVPIPIGIPPDADPVTNERTSSSSMVSLNPHAKQYFQENPEAKYWYYSANIRIPNPKIRRDPNYQPDPWPDTHTLTNS